MRQIDLLNLRFDLHWLLNASIEPLERRTDVLEIPNLCIIPLIEYRTYRHTYLVQSWLSSSMQTSVQKKIRRYTNPQEVDIEMQ